MDENVERLATVGSHPRIGVCRRADVGRWIGGRLASTVNRLKLFVRIAGEDKVVMEELLVTLFEAQVEHHT